MQIYIQLNEVEYNAFKEYRDNYNERGSLSRQIDISKEENARLIDLIKKEIPDKDLVIVDNGFTEAASYYLKPKKQKPEKPTIMLLSDDK